MVTLDRPGTTARRALWFSGLLILLAGIVGMHGLNSHAAGMAPDLHAIVMHDPGAAQVPQAPVLQAPVSVVHDLVATSLPEVTGPVAAMGAVVADGVSGVGAGMAQMCMAVLGLALTVLLRMLGNAPALPRLRLVGAAVRAPGPHGRDPDPPSLIDLSIRRC